MTPALERSASLRCHDCRDCAAPIRPDLLGAMERRFGRRVTVRTAA